MPAPTRPGCALLLPPVQPGRALAHLQCDIRWSSWRPLAVWASDDLLQPDLDMGERLRTATSRRPGRSTSQTRRAARPSRCRNADIKR